MSKTYYCHNQQYQGKTLITCTQRSDDGRCLAATSWLSRLTIECEHCKDYPYQKPINNPLNTKVDKSILYKDVSPQCPLNECRCQFNIDDNECGRYFQCKPPKKSKSIKVKVKKCKR